jgi:hypothetical protein
LFKRGNSTEIGRDDGTNGFPLFAERAAWRNPHNWRCLEFEFQSFARESQRDISDRLRVSNLKERTIRHLFPIGFLSPPTYFQSLEILSLSLRRLRMLLTNL